MRLLECLRLRVKDIEFGMNRILVRDAKGHKDRFVPLPAAVRPQLVSWLARVKQLHEEDRRNGGGGVYMPYALSASTPAPPTSGAGNGFSRPGIVRPTRARTPSGAITSTSASSSALCRSVRGRYQAARQLPAIAPPLVRDAPDRGRRHPNDPGAPRPQMPTTMMAAPTVLKPGGCGVRSPVDALGFGRAEAPSV